MKMLRILKEGLQLARGKYLRPSYSLEGEDALLNRFFEGRNEGFYVDVGAHHPFRFSNTYIFYKKGWRGINVDPAPGSMNLFRHYRPRDINLELGISAEKGELAFYMFQEPALSTFSPEVKEERLKQRFPLAGVAKVPTLPLRELLAQHLPANTEIDFLTVDVEGLDEMVLKSNDWSRFRPQFVVAEFLDSTLKEMADSKLTTFMEGNGYVFHAKLAKSAFYKRVTG